MSQSPRDVEAGTAVGATDRSDSIVDLLLTCHPVLTSRQRYHLQHYQYAGSDRSLLLRLYRPVLEKVVTWVPRYTSPNAITLTGFALLILAAAVTIYHSPHFDSPLPRWVYFLDGMCIWLYQFLDNLDGKQARRTKTSSAFGELLDHGVDAYAGTLASICFLSALRLGMTPLTLLLPFLIYFPFFMATWEQFWTGSMDLGPINGAMEGIFSLVVILFVGGAHPGIFQQVLYGEYTVGQLMCGACFALSLLCVLGNCWNVLGFIAEAQHSTDKIEVSEGRTPVTARQALLHTTSLWILLVLSALWTGYTDDLTVMQRGVAHMLLNGIVFGHIGTMLTLNHLTKQPFPSLFPYLGYMLLGVMNRLVGSVGGVTVIPESLMVWGVVAMVSLHSILYKARLASDIKSTLGIYILSLTPQQKAKVDLS